MAFLKLEIDVENPEEVITNHKGQLIGLATVFMKKEKKKLIVQKKIYEEVIKSLEVDLKESLIKEGVKAKISLTIEGEGKDEKNEVENEH